MNNLLYAPSVRVKTFFQINIQLTQCQPLKRQLFLQWHLCHKLTVFVTEFISGSSRRNLYSVLFLYLFMFAPEILVSGTKGLWYTLTSRSISLSTSSLFFKTIFAVLGSFHFHTNFRVNLSIAKKKEKKFFLVFCLGLH